MGASESNPASQGWRILEVIPNGPCWNKGLCVYFDFIVGINGVRLTTSSEEFWDTIRSKQNVEIVLTVFNYKTRIKRDVEMTPNNDWDGDGLLGLVVVREDFTKCDKQCIRILSVDQNSPASKAGLQANNDYILGTPINAFTAFSVFRDTVSDYIDQPLPIYVYNSKDAQVRLVEITPSSEWSGDGVLGCQVGDGYLHHIPSLTEQQQTIIFKPNSCYVVSSRNSTNKHKNYHSSTPIKQIQPIPDTEQKQQTQGIQEEKKEEITQEMQQEELPKIRWTDSSHGHPNEHKEVEQDQKPQHAHSEQCQHGHDATKVVPKQNDNLLDKLEQETQKVLAEQ